MVVLGVAVRLHVSAVGMSVNEGVGVLSEVVRVVVDGSKETFSNHHGTTK